VYVGVHVVDTHTHTHTGLAVPCNGPAAHVLSVALVVLAFEPSAVPMLLKLGLIDAGVFSHACVFDTHDVFCSSLLKARTH
jgi:hypothetical protein